VRPQLRSLSRFPRQLAITSIAASGFLFAMSSSSFASAHVKAPTVDDCLGCHDDSSLVRDRNKRPVAVDRAKFESSVHGRGGIACVDCHVDLAAAKDFPHPEKLATVSCRPCHESETSDYADTVHSHARKDKGNLAAATCIDCHGMHDILPKSDPDSRIHPLRVTETCGRCHGDAKTISRGRIAAGNVYALYEDSIHGHALRNKGLIVAPGCAGCHGAHSIRKAKDPTSAVYRSRIPATCGRCHEGILRQYEKGIHGEGVKAGNVHAPVCIDCHTAHSIGDTTTSRARLEVVAECGTCHVESIRTYRDTYHGQVTALGFARVATCADCHGAHDIRPQSDPASTISTVNRVKTCAKCHTRAGESFAKYDPHADPRNSERNPAVFWASRGMKWLLAGVFCFFGLHTLLWIPRSFIEARRRRKGTGEKAAGSVSTEKDSDRAGR